MQPTEAIQAIESAAKRVEEIRVESMAVGQVARQGDIYIHRVEDDHPMGKERASRQLAIGTTQGARHIAEAPAKVYEGTTEPKWCDGALLGPCVVSKERFRVGHPEHADVVLGPGTYQITHQMDANTRERVLD